MSTQRISPKLSNTFAAGDWQAGKRRTVDTSSGGRQGIIDGNIIRNLMTHGTTSGNLFSAPTPSKALPAPSPALPTSSRTQPAPTESLCVSPNPFCGPPNSLRDLLDATVEKKGAGGALQDSPFSPFEGREAKVCWSFETAGRKTICREEVLGE